MAEQHKRTIAMATTTLIGILLLTVSAYAAPQPAPQRASDMSGDGFNDTGRAAVVSSRRHGNRSVGEGALPAGDPSSGGEWQPPMLWDVIAIHAAVMPTGEVLHYSYPGDKDGSRARLWNPVTEQFSVVNMNTDIFCSGHSFLPDGSLFVTGGNDYDCQFQGRTVTNTFDSFTQTWTQLGDMSVGRWYPTNITLGDGRVLILSGLDQACELTPVMEVFTPGRGLEVVPGGERFVQLYPRLHLLTSGKVAHVGPEAGTFTFDPEAGLWQFVDHSNFGGRGNGTSVLIPGRTDQIMIIGGGFPVTGTCEIIDLSQPTPQWQWTGSMNHPRGHADALILPNKTVLVVGGGTDGLYGNPVLIPELFDPETESWTELPPHVFGRMYHATTVLLADGRVLVAGQNSGPSAFWAEIYKPAYLFQGPRPLITAAPIRIGYGQPFTIDTPQAAEIESVALIALSAVTHSGNYTQRFVEIDFTVAAEAEDRLIAVGPPNANNAPPGYYMLFILNSGGVPAIATFLQLGDPIPGDLDGDGSVGVKDLLILLGLWGPCPDCKACLADLDGDCTVGVKDLLILLGNWG